MKTTFSSNFEIIHAFASDFQDKGKYGNVFFNGGTLFSYGYHFAIAEIRDDANGERGKALFTLDTYSRSTAKQVSIARSAMNHFELIYVPRVLNTPEQNFNRWFDEVHEITQGLKTARKPEIYISKIERIAHHVRAYAEFLDIPVLPKLADILKVSNKSEAVLFDAEADLRLANYKAEKAEQERVYALKQAKKHAEDIEKFKTFELYVINERFNDRDYIRYNPSAHRFETSQGVKISFEEGQRVFNLINYFTSIKDGNPCFVVNGMYKAKNLSPDFVRVGCHNIAISDINEVAILSGMLSL